MNLTRISRAILLGWTPPVPMLDMQLGQEVRAAIAASLFTNPATQEAAVIFRSQP